MAHAVSPVTTPTSVTSFLDLSPDAVAIVDQGGRLTVVNDHLLELTGHTREQLVGQPIEVLVPERFRGPHEHTRREFTDGPSIRPMGLGRDLWLLTESGAEVAVDISLRPFTTEEGRHVAAVIRDVTAARQTQIRLERAEGELRGILEAHQDGIAMLRAVREGEDGEVTDLVVDYANQAAANLVGIPLDRLIGMTGWQASPWGGGDHDQQLLNLMSVLETGRPIRHEAEWRSPESGELLAILEVRAALAGPDRVVTAFRNVLEQRRASQQIQEMNHQLRDANAAMEQAADFQRDFISASSHELRTPLTAITGFAEMLVTRWDDMRDEQRRDAADAIRRNASRQRQLVDDLAHAAHLQSGRLRLELARVDVDAMLAEAIESVVGGDAYTLPSPSGLHVLADEGRTIQVLINLISNGLRYGATPYDLTVEDRGGQVRICVRDRGSGVPEAFVPHLFDAFAQASRGTRREAMGTGLGLYISHELAQAMHGDLSYQPAAGGGSCFHLDLPLAT